MSVIGQSNESPNIFTSLFTIFKYKNLYENIIFFLFFHFESNCLASHQYLACDEFSRCVKCLTPNSHFFSTSCSGFLLRWRCLLGTKFESFKKVPQKGKAAPLKETKLKDFWLQESAFFHNQQVLLLVLIALTALYSTLIVPPNMRYKQQFFLFCFFFAFATP